MAKWLVLVYRLPPEPSAPRVAVWRALKKLEGAYLQDGVYVTRADEYHDAVLRNLAHDVRNFGGEAHVLDVARADDERLLASRLKAGETVKARTARAPARRPRKP